MHWTQILFLSQEDPLEETVTHFSVPAWKILRTEKPGRLLFIGRKASATTEQLTFSQELTVAFFSIVLRKWKVALRFSFQFSSVAHRFQLFATP